MNLNLSILDDPQNIPDDFVLIADSTGMKLTNSGEWMRKKHLKGSKKGWVKVHIAYDPVSKQVIDVDVTDERVHDSKRLKKLIKGAKEKLKKNGKNISKVIADKGYDTHEVFRFLERESIRAVIPVRRGAKVSGRSVRDEVVRLMRSGKRKGRELTGYGMRWLVESFFSLYKRWLGEYVSSVKFENIRKEIVLKVGIVNMFMGGSMGISVRD